MVRVVLAVLFASSVAYGDPPHDLVARPIGLASGEVEGELVVEVGLDKYFVGDPISVAPDLWVGLPHAITLGAIHSDASVDHLDAGSSLCFGATCAHTYRGGGLDARITLHDDGALAIAPRVRLVVRDVDPWKPAATAGALVRWTRGRFAITGDPYLRVGLANTARGNRAALVVPIYVALQPACRWELALHTGYDTDLAVAADGYHIPVALRVRFAATHALDLGVEGGLRSAVGAQNSSGYKAVLLTLGWRVEP